MFLIEDCIYLQLHNLSTNDNEVLWYGGAETFNSSRSGVLINSQPFISSGKQPLPPLKLKSINECIWDAYLFINYSLSDIQSDIYGTRDKLGGVLQAFWMNSLGWSVKVEEFYSDNNGPLWMSFNDAREGEPPSLCLKAE